MKKRGDGVKERRRGKAAKEKDIGSALIDRLELNDSRIDSMISGLKVVSELPDPVGEITSMDPKHALNAKGVPKAM